MNDTVSSRFYAMHVPRLNAWYDAELETGNNLGRFANQLHVQEALESMKRMSASDMPEVTESDWKRIEDDFDSYCTAEIQMRRRSTASCGETRPTAHATTRRSLSTMVA